MSDFTHDLHDLASMVSQDVDLQEVLKQALAALRDIVPYDLAAVYRLYDQHLHVIAAAGPLDQPAVRQHALDLRQFPTIRRALEIRSPIPLDSHNHEGAEGDPYDGVLDLPMGHSCMVVPLYASDRNLGLITLDRRECGVYSEEIVRIAGLYGQLVSMALRFADQAALLERMRHQLQAENRRLRAKVGGGSEAGRRLEANESASMKRLAMLARQVAQSDLPALVQGETGTGKELVAQALHHWSARADGPLVTLNCAALPENLIESELFGHIKGAFTGATRDRPGAFRSADGGTLFLDEVGELPLAAQAKLLRVLQEGQFHPVGSDKSEEVDVRIIAATHVDLTEAVQAKTFREDLYYRLAVFPLQLPPLRMRTEDILPIAQDFLSQWFRNRGRGPWRLSAESRARLLGAQWPGNVRELRNVLERATILQPRGVIAPEHLGELSPQAETTRSTRGHASKPSLLPSFEIQERAYLQQLMEQTDGKLYGADGAAAIAKIPPSTLRSTLVKHGLR